MFLLLSLSILFYWHWIKRQSVHFTLLYDDSAAGKFRNSFRKTDHIYTEQFMKFKSHRLLKVSHFIFIKIRYNYCQVSFYSSFQSRIKSDYNGPREREFQPNKILKDISINTVIPCFKCTSVIGPIFVCFKCSIYVLFSRVFGKSPAKF